MLNERTVWAKMRPPYNPNKFAILRDFQTTNRLEYHAVRGDKTVCGRPASIDDMNSTLIEKGAIRGVMCLDCQRVLAREVEIDKALARLDRLIDAVNEAIATQLEWDELVAHGA